MAGEAMGGEGRIEQRRIAHRDPARLSPFAPGIEAHFLDERAIDIGDGVGRAQVIAKQEVRGVGIGPGAGAGYDHKAAEIDLMRDRAVGPGDLLIGAIGGIDAGGNAALVESTRL